MKPSRPCYPWFTCTIRSKENSAVSSSSLFYLFESKNMFSGRACSPILFLNISNLLLTLSTSVKNAHCCSHRWVSPVTFIMFSQTFKFNIFTCKISLHVCYYERSTSSPSHIIFEQTSLQYWLDSPESPSLVYLDCSDEDDYCSASSPKSCVVSYTSAYRTIRNRLFQTVTCSTIIGYCPYYTSFWQKAFWIEYYSKFLLTLQRGRLTLDSPFQSNNFRRRKSHNMLPAPWYFHCGLSKNQEFTPIEYMKRATPLMSIEHSLNPVGRWLNDFGISLGPHDGNSRATLIIIPNSSSWMIEIILLALLRLKLFYGKKCARFLPFH